MTDATAPIVEDLSPTGSRRAAGRPGTGGGASSGPLLEVQGLRTSFHTRNGVVRAVDGVSFSVARGETLGIVGESGSGKSVTCYSLMGLIPKPPGRIESGIARFDGADLLAMDESALNRIRGKRVAMIFQDPMTSLNPYLRIEDQLIEPLLIHDKVPRDEAGISVVAAAGRRGHHQLKLLAAEKVFGVARRGDQGRRQ